MKAHSDPTNASNLELSSLEFEPTSARTTLPAADAVLKSVIYFPIPIGLHINCALSTEEFQFHWTWPAIVAAQTISVLLVEIFQDPFDPTRLTSNSTHGVNYHHNCPQHSVGEDDSTGSHIPCVVSPGATTAIDQIVQPQLGLYSAPDFLTVQRS